MARTMTVSITGMPIFEELARELRAAREQIAAVRAVCEKAAGEGNHINGVSVVHVTRVLAVLAAEPTKERSE